jgi:hypothetical protein
MAYRSARAAFNRSSWVSPAVLGDGKSPPAYLREEGSSAALAGDTAGAIRAYERYLTLRVRPDPGVVQAEVDSVRAALETLRAEWSGRRN